MIAGANIETLIEMNKPLTEENFIEFCQGCYFNSECSGKAELRDDLKRIKYVKRL